MATPDNSRLDNSRLGHTRHSRDDVAQAALRILDEHGLADLTMRRLAATLDVQASALYWHFANKQTLLAALADLIVARAGTELPTDEGWKAISLAQAVALRDALLTYRDGAELVASTLALGLGAREPGGRLSRAISSGGFDDETSEAAAAVLLHFVLGHVSHEQQRIQADSLGVVNDSQAIDTAEAAVGRGSDAFRFGLELILSGLEVRSRAGQSAFSPRRSGDSGR